MDNIYIYIYIYVYIISLLSLISSHSLRPSIYLLLPYKIAFHYSPAWEIASRIKQVTSGDFCIAISYAIWVSRCRNSPVNIHTSNIVNRYQNRSLKPYHRTSCCLDIADDWIQPYKIMQTIENSAECSDDFGTICYTCNMSMKESR